MAGDAMLGIVKSASGARWVSAKTALSASEIDRHAAALIETIDDLSPVYAVPFTSNGTIFSAMVIARYHFRTSRKRIIRPGQIVAP